MGLYDVLYVPRNEIAFMGIIEQLGIVIPTPVVLQTKDIRCLSCRYLLRHCTQSKVLYLSNVNCDSIFKINRQIRATNHFYTDDDKEVYIIEFLIKIKRGIVQSIAIENIFKLGNKQYEGEGGTYSIVNNDVPMDKGM